MPRTLVLVVFLFGVRIGSSDCFASDFQLRLEVENGKNRSQTEQTEESPTLKKPKTRPIVELPRDRTATIAWQAENTGKVPFNDVLVHFFVVAEEKVGQVKVPKLTESVVYEGALTMDFKPHEKADWRFTVRVREPGNYLLRVETIGLMQQHGHEHFTAIDLVVK